MTKMYKVGVAAERVVEVEAKNSHEAIAAALAQMGAEGRTVLGTLRVEPVLEDSDRPELIAVEHDRPI